MTLENTFDKIHAAAVNDTRLQFLTVFTRIILAVGFIPPSIVKILGKPFTVLPDSHPVGHYFNALYQTGYYYEFIGWAQLAAALLLLVPRTAHLGAILFLPIILNITVLTNSVGFVGTKYITMLMFAASAYLVCWEYDRWKPLIFSERETRASCPKFAFFLVPFLFAVGGAGVACLFAYAKVANFHLRFLTILIALTASGFVFGLICSLHHKFMQVGNLEKPVTVRFEKIFLPLAKSAKKL